MAFGNIFDNRPLANDGKWRPQWKGDMSFREVDIKYLVDQLKAGVNEPKMEMQGEERQGKKGPYLNIKLKQPWTGKSSQPTPAPEPKKESEVDLDKAFNFDDL